MYICIYIRAQVFARVRAPRADPSNHSSLQGRDLNVTKYKLRYFKFVRGELRERSVREDCKRSERLGLEIWIAGEVVG